MRHALLILTAFGPPPSAFDGPLADGRLRAVRQPALTDVDIEAAAGVVTTMHLDQVDLAARRNVLDRYLASGGRIAFNGHALLPFVTGIAPYRPLPQQRRADLQLRRIGFHPLFEGIDQARLTERRGVAGFYGRGHSPAPPGGLGLTGIGNDRLPVDWEWLTPAGGGVFMHAGNDLWTVADDPAVNRRLAERLVDWCLAHHPVEVAR